MGSISYRCCLFFTAKGERKRCIQETLHKARGKRWEFSEYCHDFRKTTQQRRFFHSQFVKNEVPFLVVLPKSRQISCAVFTLSG